MDWTHGSISSENLAYGSGRLFLAFTQSGNTASAVRMRITVRMRKREDFAAEKILYSHRLINIHVLVKSSGWLVGVGTGATALVTTTIPGRRRRLLFASLADNNPLSVRYGLLLRGGSGEHL